MAVSVGKAEGKLTLDASNFITNINKAYEELESFGKLVADTQTTLNNMSSGSTGGLFGGGSSSGGGLFGFDPNAFREVFSGQIPDNVEKSTKSVSLLQEALSTGLSGALKGVEGIAELTFNGFKKYVEEVVRFAKDSLQTGLGFDAMMSQVQAIAGSTDEQLVDLRNEAIKMGNETKFSAQEAAEAMKYMGMAGWDTTQILDGLGGVMSLAAASGEDLGRASDIVTDALTAFGMRAEDTARFADVLASAASNSNTNVSLMGETFKYVAPFAGTMKYNIEDTAVAIGLMANNGIKGSQAGTALRNVIGNLVSPSKPAAQAMNDLGLSLVDAEGNTKSLMTVMQDLRGAFSGITNDADMEAYRHEIENLNQALESGEITEEEYVERSEEIGSALLKSVDTLQAKYASAIAGKYGLSGLLAIVNATDEDFQKLTNEIYAAGTSLESISDAVQNSGVEWDKYTDKAWATEQGMSTIAASIVNDINNLGRSTQEVQKHLNLEFGLNEEDAITAIQAVQGALEGTTGSAADMEQTMMDNLQGSITIFQSTMETFKIRISDMLKDPAKEFVNFGQQAIAQMTEGIEQEGIPGLLDAVSRIIPEAVATAVDAIPDVIPPLVEGFWTLVNGVIDAIPDALPKVVNAAIGLFHGLIEGLADATKHLNEILPEVLGDLAGLIANGIPVLLDSAVEFFLALVEGVAIALPDILKTVSGLLPRIIDVIIKHIDDIIQTGIDLIVALIEGLTDPEVLHNLFFALERVVEIIISTLEDVDWLTVGDKIFKALGDALLNVMQAALNLIDELLGTNFAEWGKQVSTFFNNLRTEAFNLGKTIANRMNKSENELNDLESKYSSNYSDMLSMYAELVKKGADAQEAMAAAYQQYFSSAEAQYVFRERFADDITGASGGTGITGFGGMSQQDLLDTLTRATTVSGNTYNFYSPEAIDERTAADQMKKTATEIILNQ